VENLAQVKEELLDVAEEEVAWGEGGREGEGEDEGEEGQRKHCS
jgi:hypothetical protein